MTQYPDLQPSWICVDDGLLMTNPAADELWNNNLCSAQCPYNPFEVFGTSKNPGGLYASPETPSIRLHVRERYSVRGISRRLVLRILEMRATSLERCLRGNSKLPDLYISQDEARYLRWYYPELCFTGEKLPIDFLITLIVFVLVVEGYYV